MGSTPPAAVGRDEETANTPGADGQAEASAARPRATRKKAAAKKKSATKKVAKKKAVKKALKKKSPKKKPTLCLEAALEWVAEWAEWEEWETLRICWVE